MTAKKGKTTRRPTLETLEPRLLFSADILGAFGSALNPDQEVEVDSGVDTTSFIYVNNDSDDQSDLLDAGSGDDQRFELILIDANVDGYEALIEDLWANKDDQTDLEIVVLDPDTDGVDQITDILDDYAGLDAVHLISHGSGNGVQIGGTWLDADSLSANRDAVAAWGEALGQEADLLIYGCNLAATEAGTSLLDNLSLLIGADVAASDDPTGAEVLGGDWDLEHESCVVETDIAFSRQIQQQWSGILLDTTAPTIESKETVDLDGDGYIDALHITFSEAVDDTTVTIGNWDVEGVTGEAFSSTTNSDTADDSDIYITFTDGVLANDATPELIYTQGTLEDLAGNLLVSNSADAWWDESWQNRTKITFSGNDAGGSENLDNFTVLVSLTAADVDFDKIKADGADIRFMDSDNATELSYQIESWDDSAKTATIWVKVPRIDQGSTTDHIFLYYNNTDATDASSTAAWDSKYQGVWHMNEGTGVSQVDSTGNTNDASPVNSPVATDGKMGGGLTIALQTFHGARRIPSDLDRFGLWQQRQGTS